MDGGLNGGLRLAGVLSEREERAGNLLALGI